MALVMHRMTAIVRWMAVLALVLGASARRVDAQDHLGSVNDYINTNPDFPEADEIPRLGIAVTNGGGTLQNRYRFDGVEVVGVIPGSPGATAGLKGEQRRMQMLMTVGILAASMFFPPAMLGAAVLGSSGIGESHEFIIAVDGIRVHDVIEFGEALNQAQPGEMVYLTVVANGHRKQLELALSG